jgi:hypothetical protein
VSGFVYLLVSKRCFAVEEERTNIKEAKPETVPRENIIRPYERFFSRTTNGPS